MHENSFFLDFEPRFTRGEYWVLETVVESLMPLSLLVAENLEELLNKTGHGLAQPALLEALDRLFSTGLLQACQGWESEHFFVPTREQIQDALQEKGHQNLTYYGLTAEGGKQWEAFARPRWENFLHVSYERLSPTRQRGEFICANQRRLERYFQGIHYLKQQCDPATVVREELRPWQATYWKQLPLGYCICFECEEVGSFEWDDIPLTYYWLHDDNWYSWR